MKTRLAARREAGAAGEQLSEWDVWCLRHVVEHAVCAEAGAVSAGSGFSDLEALVCDLRYVESKAEVGMGFDLAKEFARLQALHGDVECDGENSAQAAANSLSPAHAFHRFALHLRARVSKG